MSTIRIGVLALQGDFREHKEILQSIGSDIAVVEVRTPAQLQEINGLIIPGGESTAIVNLASTGGLLEPLKSFTKNHPTWGTCAGLVCLADELTNSSQKKGGQIVLGGLHCLVDRNHFGRQLQSFEEELQITDARLQSSEHTAAIGVFIRAPCILRTNSDDVRVLAQLGRTPGEPLIVAVQQNHLMATAFHPELTKDWRWHAHFVRMVREFVHKK